MADPGMPENWAWEDEGILADACGRSVSLADADTLCVESDTEEDCPSILVPLACVELLTGRKLAAFEPKKRRDRGPSKMTVRDIVLLDAIVATGECPDLSQLISAIGHVLHDMIEYDGTSLTFDARRAVETVLDLPDDTPDEDLVRAAARARLAELAADPTRQRAEPPQPSQPSPPTVPAMPTGVILRLCIEIMTPGTELYRVVREYARLGGVT